MKMEKVGELSPIASKSLKKVDGTMWVTARRKSLEMDTRVQVVMARTMWVTG
jgi:hypothetical protein